MRGWSATREEEGCPGVTSEDAVPQYLSVKTQRRQRWAPVWLDMADHIACASHHTLHDITHLYGVDPRKATVIYQGVSDAFQPVTDTLRLEQVRARYGVEAPYVLCVGRVELLKAFYRVVKRRSGKLMLVLAGPRDEDVHDPEGVLPG